MTGRWDARIRRALELASSYPSATEGLNFYAKVAALQRDLFAEFQKLPPSSLQDSVNIAAVLPKFPRFLSEVARIAPPPLADAAATLANEPHTWPQALDDFLHDARTRREAAPDDAALANQCLAWLFLQPVAESITSRQPRAAVDGTPLTCPLCGARPMVGVLRPEGDGASKSLVCMLCAHEWNFRRVCCPACGEDREPQIAFYSAPEIPHVRVDVCDTCHCYLKSVDLTKTRLAVPTVDELVALPLDLWAREQGYEKLQMNILGI